MLGLGQRVPWDGEEEPASCQGSSWALDPQESLRALPKRGKTLLTEQNTREHHQCSSLPIELLLYSKPLSPFALEMQRSFFVGVLARKRDSALR